jgi:hypothetical protein
MRTTVEVQALAGASREMPAEVPPAVRQDNPAILSSGARERDQVGGPQNSDAALRAGVI